jgi:hypothetical protein
MIARQNEVMRTAAKVKNFTGMVFLILNNPMLTNPFQMYIITNYLRLKLASSLLVGVINIVKKNREAFAWLPG